MLRFGSRGPEVTTAQQNLNLAGKSRFRPLVEDGIFGAKTRERVFEFQSAHQLSPDGIVGPLTQGGIKEALAAVLPQQVAIAFDGCFQLRLATDPAPSDASPKAPPPANSGLDLFKNGWTFAYNEARFDRKMRLSNPVNLRTGLLSPYQPVRVSKVTITPASPLAAVASNALMGQFVSFGLPKLSGQVARETLGEITLAIGSSPGFAITAKPAAPVVVETRASNSNAAAEAEYLQKKPTVKGSITNPQRKAVVDMPIFIQTWADRFKLRGNSNTVSLKDVNGTILGGALQLYDWKFQTSFFRFDGDALIGRMEGSITGTRK